MSHQLFSRRQHPAQRQAARGQRLHQGRVAVSQERLHVTGIEPGPILGQKRFVSLDAVVRQRLNRDVAGGRRGRVLRGGRGGSVPFRADVRGQGCLLATVKMGVAGVVFLFLDAERNAEPGNEDYSINLFCSRQMYNILVKKANSMIK